MKCQRIHQNYQLMNIYYFLFLLLCLMHYWQKYFENPVKLNFFNYFFSFKDIYYFQILKTYYKIKFTIIYKRFILFPIFQDIFQNFPKSFRYIHSPWKASFNRHSVYRKRILFGQYRWWKAIFRSHQKLKSKFII